MRIVILTAIPFWHPGTAELIGELREKKVEVIALDIFHGFLIDKSNPEPINLIPLKLKGFIAKIYMKLFRRSFIKRHIWANDIVDLHFVEPYYGKYIKTIKEINTKVIASLFGSDLFRTSPSQKIMQKIIFELSDAIVLSKNMVEHFESSFPGFSKKFYFNQYGSKRLDIIQQMKKSVDRSSLRDKYGISKNQIVITCGYNAKKEQQHLKLLTEIERLPEEYKEEILLIFPLTYGHEAAYLDELKSKIDAMKIQYIWYERRLEVNELVETKLVSDITINTQTSDALASSIKEAMAAGDILLLGDWLPYEIYAELNIFYVKCSFESLKSQLILILENLKEFKAKSIENEQRIIAFASWKTLINDWVRLYEGLNNGRK